jgi:hypothetical protein
MADTRLEPVVLSADKRRTLACARWHWASWVPALSGGWVARLRLFHPRPVNASVMTELQAG